MNSKSLTEMTRLCSAIGLVFASHTNASVAMAAETDAITRVIVQFKSSASASAEVGPAAMASIAKAGGRVKLVLARQNAMAIELPASAVSTLSSDPNVLYIEADPKRYPSSTGQTKYRPGQTVPYGIKMVQADQMPQGDAAASNMKVCIIDTGLDRSHEDLKGNNVTGDSDPEGAGPWYRDGYGHGTHVAGTIAAINNKNVGVVGVLPGKQVNLHIVRVFGDDGAWAYSSTLLAATNKCEDAGANIISMSLGGSAPSAAEDKNFKRLAEKGILSIAAAGNGGNTAVSYPAGYRSVMSVAAVDKDMKHADFSQSNADVEIAAPGVAVLSTVPKGLGLQPKLTVGTSNYEVLALVGSPEITATAPLADFGIGDAQNAAVSGKVCVIARGTNTFAEKVKNCELSGGVGAVIYNNVPGNFTGSLGTTLTSIPSVSASDVDGAALRGQLGQTATVGVVKSNYASFNGTSMATPHVAGVAALVWSYFPTCTNEQIRLTLTKSALDLGTPGLDPQFGHGLVQAKAAYDRASTLGCGN